MLKGALSFVAAGCVTTARSFVAAGPFIAAGLLVASSANAAINLTFFPASTYNTNVAAMNAALGISTYRIEDFSTVTFPKGLSVVQSGGGVTTTTWDFLPALYDQNTLPADCYGYDDSIANLGIASWTGAYAASNLVSNILASCYSADGAAQTTTFRYAPGVTSFGIGLANFQSLDSPQFPVTNHELFVNGVDMGVIETLAGANWTPGITLNAYLRIDATADEAITSVAIESISAGDFLGFSDLALLPVVAPTVKPVIKGTAGDDGWYVSDAKLSWTVTGNPAPTTSGCGPETVPNTAGATYTCSATNFLASAQQSVTVRVDTVAPQVTLAKPANGGIYALKAVERASYTCADATSGIAACTGTVAEGAAFATGTLGAHAFSVTATDVAGNTSEKTVTYTVETATPTPTFVPAGGTYSTPQTVSISDANPAAVIYCTTNGTVPTSTSPVCAAPISVGASETLNAIAIAPGEAESLLKTAVYTID